jgi:DNA-binding SARP family transcriptional activator
VTELLHLRLLGHPEVNLSGAAVTEALTAKAQAVLYYLAVAGPTGQPRSVLAHLLWGDAPEAAARANLRKALANLRQTLGEFLDLDGQTIAFKPSCRYWVDVVEFVAKTEGRPWPCIAATFWPVSMSEHWVR